MNHKDTKDTKKTSEELSFRMIGAAIEVHKALGAGLLESAYEQCLCRELSLQGIPFERQVALPVEYKGLRLECGYKLDILVGGLVIVELKAVEQLAPIHTAQLLTYLRLSGLWLGLLINFHVPRLKDGGIERVVN
jgi:GxxExxY protein